MGPPLVEPAGAVTNLEPRPLFRGKPVDLFDASAAEIVKFDSASQRMFVVNGAADSIDIFDASNPAAPTLVKSVDLSALGNPNSVDVNPHANEVSGTTTIYQLAETPAP